MDDNDGGGKLPAKDAGLSNSALSVGMALIFVGNLIASDDGESVNLATALGRADADHLWMVLLGLAAENPTVSHYDLLVAAQIVLQRWSADRGASTAFNPSAFRLAIQDMVREDEETPPGATRGSYKCGRCRVPKKGHICTFEPVFFRGISEEPEANHDMWSLTNGSLPGSSEPDDQGGEPSDNDHREEDGDNDDESEE
ncbi:expressed unknown protein [Seminavis robusta]|uniref:Uncharacterized protein n=1 Tax=Seminavis robusta TaxID=568900 RepID=A0A9N8ENH1_9STRA|nr:expressed unknown protein [Seminavis robusta]|eukprot:Sro1316_g262120.1 n/a (199) ;mRNA; r:3172-3768